MVQECGAGLLPLSLEEDHGRRRIFVKSPPARLVILGEPWVRGTASALRVGLPANRDP